MEIGWGPMRAAAEEVRVRTVPEVNGWESAAQSAAQKKGLEEGGLGEEEEEAIEEEVEEVDKVDDDFGIEANMFMDTWNRRYSSYCGCFEDETKIPNKRFTYKEPHDGARPQTTLQVFAIKIAKVRVGLQWPLQVFGMVAIRDCIDQNRNVIFDRPRHNCQIVTREDPYLKLTGPKRAVVVLDPATFEVDLKIKCTTGSEDQWLSFLAVTYRHFSRLKSHLFEREYASKLSELQFHLGSIISSVEATIEVRIINGSWPRGLCSQFTAGTASIPGAKVILLDSGDNEGPNVKFGSIQLSRSVVSVEVNGQLSVCVKAFLGDRIVVNKAEVFKAKKAGVSRSSLSVNYYVNEEISTSKSKTAGKGASSLDVGLNDPGGFLGCCELGFKISWSVITCFR